MLYVYRGSLFEQFNFTHNKSTNFHRNDENLVMMHDIKIVNLKSCKGEAA